MTACIQTRSSRSCSPIKIQFQKIAQTRKYYIDAPVHASYDGYTTTCRSFSFPVYKTRFECFYSCCQPAGDGGEVKKKKKSMGCGTHPMRYTFLSIFLASPVGNTTDFTGHRCSKSSLGITVARWFSGENFETPLHLRVSAPIAVPPRRGPCDLEKDREIQSLPVV